MPSILDHVWTALQRDWHAITQVQAEARAERERLQGELTNPLDVASISEWGAADLGHHDRPTA